MSKKNLKANHNTCRRWISRCCVVLNIVKEKSESKSQHDGRSIKLQSVVLNIVKEKSESKSQHLQAGLIQSPGCFKYCQRKI